MKYTRVHRLLKIISFVQAERGYNAKRLAKECATSTRTIYRDIEQLIAAGIPIEFDRASNGYTITGSFFMPPVQLTPEEALALAALCEHISKPERIPFLKSAWRAMHKIESQLPTELQRELADRTRNLVIHTAAAAPPDGVGDVYERIQQALAERRVLRCRYEAVTSDGDDGEFELRPECLFFGVRAWYVVGRRSDRNNEYRVLKLNRFERIVLTDQTYRRDKSFDLDAFLGNAWRMIRDGDDVEIELWFDSDFAQTVTETHWHRTQSFQWHPDGSCTFRCKVSGFSEIVWWILSMGPHCIVRKPAELARYVQDLASRTAALYDRKRSQNVCGQLPRSGNGM